MTEIIHHSRRAGTGPVTVLDLALHRLELPRDFSGALNGADFEAVDLAMLGGCEVCGAQLAAYNASPSKSGYWRCLNSCIGDLGFATVEDAEAWLTREADAEGDA